jgi:hypothetical protein
MKNEAEHPFAAYRAAIAADDAYSAELRRVFGKPTKDDYAGPRCDACSEPATYRVTEPGWHESDAWLACDDCIPDCGAAKLTEIPEAGAARDAQGQL